MKVVFRCLPELEDLLPRPIAAREGLPEWLKAMPSTAFSTLLQAEVRTLKQCPPFIDAMSTGFLMLLPCDVRVEDGTLSWDWEIPALGKARTSRSPVGVHVAEQGAGAPLGLQDGDLVVKFNSFWSIAVPDGWSVLFTHPFNRPDLPFRTLTGVVDCDRFRSAFVHFPALWADKAFSGTIPRGTPVAQCVPVERTPPELDIGVLDENAQAEYLAVQDAMAEDPGVYRKRFRASRK